MVAEGGAGWGEMEVTSNGCGISFFFFFLITYFILFLAVLSLHCYMWAFSSCSEHRLLSNCGVWTSHYGGFSCGVWVLEVWTQ